MTEGEVRGGPFVRGAFFCETILQERDSVNTYVRVTDRVTRHAVGTDAPEELEPFDYMTNLVVITTAGDARGRSVLTLQIESPDGLVKSLGPPVDLTWQRPSSGMNLHLGLQIRLIKEGVYWVKVIVDGQVMTQVPLEVIYSRMPPGAARSER